MKDTRETTHNNAIKYLEVYLEEYKEKREMWERKKIMLLGEWNIWTKRDLESEVIYWENEVKKSAFKVADNLLMLSLENKAFADIFKNKPTPASYKGMTDQINIELRKENEKLRSILKVEGLEYKQVEKEEKENKKPHCIGCKNSQEGVCKKHNSSADKTLDLSNPEDMKEYKKQWRKKRKSEK